MNSSGLRPLNHLAAFALQALPFQISPSLKSFKVGVTYFSTNLEVVLMLATYFITIFSLQWFMRDRKAYSEFRWCGISTSDTDGFNYQNYGPCSWWALKIYFFFSFEDSGAFDQYWPLVVLFVVPQRVTLSCFWFTAVFDAGGGRTTALSWWSLFGNLSSKELDCPIRVSLLDKLLREPPRSCVINNLWFFFILFSSSNSGN